MVKKFTNVLTQIYQLKTLSTSRHIIAKVLTSKNTKTTLVEEKEIHYTCKRTTVQIIADLSSETMNVSRYANTSLKQQDRGKSKKISFKNGSEIHFQIKEN